MIVGGLLQAQPAMPLGLASNVTEPPAAGPPGWVRALEPVTGDQRRHPLRLVRMSGVPK